MEGQWSGAPATTVSHISPIGNSTHRVFASYAGDANYLASVSATTPLTAVPQATTLALTATPLNSATRQLVVLTATLTPGLAQNHNAGGTVSYYSSGALIASGTVVNGVATTTVTGLPVGTNTLTATYVSDGYFATSTAPPVFTMASNPALVTPVGSTSAVQQGVLTFYQGGTLTGMAVLTQGAANLYFKIAPDGTCSLGISNLANGVCTFNYTFTPGRPGTRYGAVVGTDGFESVIATTYVQGAGTGPKVNFPFGSQS